MEGLKITLYDVTSENKLAAKTEYEGLRAEDNPLNTILLKNINK